MIGWSDPHPSNLSAAYSDPSSYGAGIRLDSEHEEIRTVTQADFRFCRLPVQPQRWQDQTHSRMLADLKLENPETDLRPCLLDLTAYVPDSPRADTLLFTPECAGHSLVVSIAEFYAEFRNLFLTKIGWRVNSQFDSKEGYRLSKV